MDPRLKNRLSRPLDDRAAEGLERQVAVFDPTNSILDLSNNDYLGLGRHPKVIAAANEAADQYGCSASASPLITGFGPAHHSLLATLKDWHGFAHGMIWNSGYTANQAVLSGLPEKGDLVLADRLIHNSMVSGILGSGARLIRYPHCSAESVERQLQHHALEDRIVFVVTESVFSMDGDYPDLAAMAKLKLKYPFFWIVDEAHALGWYGQSGSGLVEEVGIGSSVDLLVGTLGKGLGSMGAYTLFHDDTVKRYLENFAGEFIYSTYLAPSAAAAAKKAVELAQGMGSERETARQYSRELRRRLRSVGLAVPDGEAPIVPVQIGEVRSVMQAAAALDQAEIRVGAIRPPTVPDGQSRLRISLRVGMSYNVQDTLVNILKPFAKSD